MQSQRAWGPGASSAFQKPIKMMRANQFKKIPFGGGTNPLLVGSLLVRNFNAIHM